MNRLARWRTGRGLSQEALAERLGITQGHASRILAGKQKPGLRVALAIEALTEGEVPASCWDEPPRRRSA